MATLLLLTVTNTDCSSLLKSNLAHCPRVERQWQPYQCSAPDPGEHQSSSLSAVPCRILRFGTLDADPGSRFFIRANFLVIGRRSATAEAKNGKSTPPTPKGSRASKPVGTKSPANGTPLQAPRGADRSPGSTKKPPSGDRRAPKVFARLSTPPSEVWFLCILQCRVIFAASSGIGL
jgi:hypothetical protein